MIIATKMHMEEELANLFHNVVQIKKRMELYVIQNAIKDIMVLDLYVGRAVPQDLVKEELIAINHHPTEEEQDMRFGQKENVRVKILKAVKRTVLCGILNVETVSTQLDVAFVRQIV
jgi:hypothetical protein